MNIQPANTGYAVSQIAEAKPAQSAQVAAPAEQTVKKAQPDNLYEGQGEHYDMSV